MKLTFLGTGTSTGVPQIGCSCETCTSSDSRDRRLRTSAIITTDEGRNILLDCGPDFRQQMLGAGSPELAAALLTHQHYDHVGGIDDIRPYTYPDGFAVYCKADVAADLRARMPYCFGARLYPGVPVLHLKEIDPWNDFVVAEAGIKVTPVPVMHWQLPIIGFRIGRFAYITDCKTMSEESVKLLEGVDTLVLNALRAEPHNSHLSLSEALEIIKVIDPRTAYLTHLSHQMGCHAEVESQLPDNVRLAYDGLVVEV
ncbi:MAG: MBL fold metallo-hydrolase [Muribaculaceae bacterium]|nr:MBL fold metallo-hydrolase [Muribaculaceae bacterium]